MILLRRLGRAAEAEDALQRLLADDPLNPISIFLDSGRLPQEGRTIVDVALELAQAGEGEAALDTLAAAAAIPSSGAGGTAPIAHYHRAAILDGLGREEEAAAARVAARSSNRRWCFPAGLDDHDALVAALEADADPVAGLLLGMLLFDAGRRRDALSLWEDAIGAGLTVPLLFRNAGLASYNVTHDDVRALLHYERAVELAPADPRLLFERDQLAKRLGESDEERLQRLSDRFEVVAKRDDLVVEYAELLVSTGRPADALALLEGRSFQPWEGGEGRVLGAWDHARAALGLPVGDPPLSLGEGRPLYEPPVARRADGEIDYFATSLPDLLLFYRSNDPDPSYFHPSGTTPAPR